MPDFNAAEVLVVTEEGIETVTDLRGIAVAIHHAADNKHVVVEHMPCGDTQAGVVGQVDST